MYIADFAKNLFKKANAGVIVYLVINIMLYVALFGGFSSPGMAGLSHRKLASPGAYHGRCCAQEHDKWDTITIYNGQI
jgi:hypothetical protein